MSIVFVEFLNEGSNVDELWRQLIWWPVFAVSWFFSSLYVQESVMLFKWVMLQVFLSTFGPSWHEPTWDEHSVLPCFANWFPNEGLSKTSTYSPTLAPAQIEILLVTPTSARGSRYFVIEGQFLGQFHMSSDGKNVSLYTLYCHAWLAIYFSGSIDVCQVFGISILCLVMFGFVSIADVFLVSFFIHLLNLSASYHLICQLRTH